MTITRMRRSEVKIEGREIRTKMNMKIFDVIHVRALKDNYKRHS
jgi:hypothetical protein